MRTYTFPITVDSSGAGTVLATSTSPYLPPEPLDGYIVAVRMANAGTALTSTGGTTTFTFTSVADGGTVAKATGPAPFHVFPARTLTTQSGGTTAYNTGVGPVVDAGVPVDGYVQLVVANGQPSKSGTVFLTVACDD